MTLSWLCFVQRNAFSDNFTQISGWKLTTPDPFFKLPLKIVHKYVSINYLPNCTFLTTSMFGPMECIFWLISRQLKKKQTNGRTRTIFSWFWISVLALLRATAQPSCFVCPSIVRFLGNRLRNSAVMPNFGEKYVTSYPQTIYFSKF